MGALYEGGDVDCVKAICGKRVRGWKKERGGQRAIWVGLGLKEKEGQMYPHRVGDGKCLTCARSTV